MPTLKRRLPEVTQHHELGGGKVIVLAYGVKAGKKITDRMVAKIVEGYGITRVYHPDPSGFNAIVNVPPSRKWKSRKIGGVTIHSKALVEGVILRPGMAAWFRTADCATVVAHNHKTGQTGVAHAGRGSLVDEAKIRGLHSGNKARRDESVIDALARVLIPKKTFARHIETWSGVCIGPSDFGHPFGHPLYGGFNCRLVDYLAHLHGSGLFLGPLQFGQFDLRSLILRQWLGHSVPRENISQDDTDTVTDRRFGLGGHYDWYSRRREARVGKRGINPGRNSIIVMSLPR